MVSNNRRFLTIIRRASSRLRFSLSSLLIVVTAAALVMAWNVSSPGSVPIRTGRELDIAIFGIGHFQFTMPNGQICYTRHGHFSLNRNGQIVIGRPEDDVHIQPELNLPQDWKRVLVTPTGLVQVQQGGAGTWSNIGQIELVRFSNTEALAQVAPDMWGETDNSGSPLSTNPGDNGTGFVCQGFLEPPAGPPREQLRYQLALFAAGSLGFWVIVQNRALRHDLTLLKTRLGST